LNVIENILFPKKITSKISTAEMKFAKRLLQRIQLNGFEERNVLTLSGRENQRIAVLRAIITRPCIVIDYEPTGSLDEKSDIMIMDMVINLCRESARLLLLTTHNQLFAQKASFLSSRWFGAKVNPHEGENKKFSIRH
jgi:ABC-type lipoprotein export system ATPase subunit